MSHSPNCLNCGAVLAGPFCAACGQKDPEINPSMRELVREVTHEFMHWDGKIPATMKALLFSPGQLTADFLAGRRARWISPLRLYLICSLLFFTSKPIIENLTGRTLRQMAQVSLRDDRTQGPLTPEERAQLEAGLPARFFRIEQLERAATDSAALNRAVEAATAQAMFVLMPLFAFMTWVAWRRPGLRYPAHLYLSLNLHSAAFALFALLTVVRGLVPSDIIVGVFSLAVLGYLGWYYVRALRRVFGRSRLATFVRAAAVGAMYALLLLFTALGLLGYAVTRM